MSGESTRPRSVKLLAALCLVAVFAAGFLVGAAATRAHDRQWGPPPFGMGGEAHHGPRPNLFAPDGPLGQRLHLTHAQADSIDRIVKRDQREAEQMMRAFHPRLRAHFDSTTAAIGAVLTPPQRAEFERFLERHHPRRGRGPAGGPPPGTPPPEPR
ncbi:MAG: hypothetical protein JWM27_214 [Gemmatimonadetes bacterium]|nr:hypothetical protein [Gemmatimonadota bacterium]